MINKKYVAKDVAPNKLEFEKKPEGWWRVTFKQVNFREWLEAFELSTLEHGGTVEAIYDWGRKNNCETLYDWRKWIDVVENGAYDEKEYTERYKRITELYDNEDSAEHKFIMKEIELDRTRLTEMFWKLVCQYAQFQADVAEDLLFHAKQSYGYAARSLAREQTWINQMKIDANPRNHQDLIDVEASEKLQAAETSTK